MVVDFYYVPGSGPCRAAMLTARAVGVELNLKYVDLKSGEHLKPEFLAVCFQHIPKNDAIVIKKLIFR
jgi:glutathione S-transferase